MGKPQPKQGRRRLVPEWKTKLLRRYTQNQYEKYRLQFPRVPQSEIVAKILREYDSWTEEELWKLKEKMDMKACDQLYEDKDSSQHNSPKKGTSRPIESEKGSMKETKKKGSPKVKVFFEPATVRRFQMPQVKLDAEISNSDQEDSQFVKPVGGDGQVNQDGNPGLQTLRCREETFREMKRCQFVKYYYERLRAEHPKWSRSQVYVIINGLWKHKMLARLRRFRQKQADALKPRRGLSGLQYYAMQKRLEGYTNDMIRSMWTALPFECKVYWGIQANPTRKKHRAARKTPLAKLMRFGATNQRNEVGTLLSKGIGFVVEEKKEVKQVVPEALKRISPSSNLSWMNNEIAKDSQSPFSWMNKKME